MVDIYYADTSALLKRYVQESGSAWLTALITPENQIVSTLPPLPKACALTTPSIIPKSPLVSLIIQPNPMG